MLETPGLVLILFLTSAVFCHANPKTVQVFGITQCSDCNTNAFKAMKVSIDCKDADGEMKSISGLGELDEGGKFRVQVPEKMVENGKLKEECYAQLHTTSSSTTTVCPTSDHNKIQYYYVVNGKHTFNTLKYFSPTACASTSPQNKNFADQAFPRISFPRPPRFPPGSFSRFFSPPPHPQNIIWGEAFPFKIPPSFIPKGLRPKPPVYNVPAFPKIKGPRHFPHAPPPPF